MDTNVTGPLEGQPPSWGFKPLLSVISVMWLSQCQISGMSLCRCAGPARSSKCQTLLCSESLKCIFLRFCCAGMYAVISAACVFICVKSVLTLRQWVSPHYNDAAKSAFSLRAAYYITNPLSYIHNIHPYFFHINSVLSRHPSTGFVCFSALYHSSPLFSPHCYPTLQCHSMAKQSHALGNVKKTKTLSLYPQTCEGEIPLKPKLKLLFK